MLNNQNVHKHVLIFPLMPLLDIHAHLDDEQFKPDLDEVLQRARDAGVTTIITNGLDIQTNRSVLLLAKKYHLIKPALGLYPDEAIRLVPSQLYEEIDFIEKNKNKIIAIGEVGLDGKHHKDRLDEQKEAFSLMIDLAMRINKPLIVHSSQAEQECIDLLTKKAPKKVVFHCFGGSLEQAKDIKRKGWYFSIPPIILRNQSFQDLVQLAGPDRLLTETDSPYLSSVKGKRNEPAEIPLVIKKIAELEGLSAGEVENIIYKNYSTLFL